MKGFTYIAVAAAAVALAGCTVHQTDPPSLTGPSVLALSITATASPQSITQNGNDASVITARVLFTDPTTGATTPKGNLPIRFDMQVAGVAQDFGTLSARSVVTDSNGVARTTFTAPPMPVGGNSGTCNGVPGTCVTILATIADATSANPAVTGSLAPASATILLMPPGVIRPPAGTPVASFTLTPIVSSPPPTIALNATTIFDASGSTPGTGASQITSYAWNFGDGATTSGVTATHVFSAVGTFNVTLTVTNDRGLSASTTQAVTVTAGAAPNPVIDVSPSTIHVNDTVFLSGLESTADKGHTIVRYDWDFGDGSPAASGMTTTHVYPLANVYVVTLTVTDDLGQKKAVTKTVTVIP